MSGISYRSSDTELRTDGWLDNGSRSFFGSSISFESWRCVVFACLSSEAFVCSVVCPSSVILVFGDVLKVKVVLGGSAGGWSLSSAFCDWLVSVALSVSVFFTPGVVVADAGRESLTREGTGDPWGVSGGEV